MQLLKLRVHRYLEALRTWRSYLDDFVARITNPATGAPASMRNSAWAIFGWSPEKAAPVNACAGAHFKTKGDKLA
jgi:hypothetical protein